MQITKKVFNLITKWHMSIPMASRLLELKKVGNQWCSFLLTLILCTSVSYRLKLPFIIWRLGNEQWITLINPVYYQILHTQPYRIETALTQSYNLETLLWLHQTKWKLWLNYTEWELWDGKKWKTKETSGFPDTTCFQWAAHLALQITSLFSCSTKRKHQTGTVATFGCFQSFI